MLWSFFHLDNMDEKEKADRMAAAEALYMISTRVDKSGTLQRSPRRGRKKKNYDDFEETTTKRKGENGTEVVVTANNSRRGRGKKVVHEGRADAAGVVRGGGGKSPSSSAKGRIKTSKSRARGQPRQQSVDDYNNYEENSQRINNSQQLKRNSTGVGDKILPEHVDIVGDSKRRSKPRSSKKRNKRTKTNSPSSSYDDFSHAPEADDNDDYLAIGFTGAAISINEPNNKRSSVESSQTLQSQGLVSGFRQVSLSSRSLPSTAAVYGLPSVNLTSFTTDLNLPSIPLEIGSLQLSSQPTPNLSSLGDLTEGVLVDDCMSVDRKKSEKFLPLKKRKLHKPSEAEVREPTPPLDASSLSDSEERSEPQSPPPQHAEPVRATFTVQAPPIITMQTLMEIKTALTADDDGDLPLHIAVVHENMRMVIKLINLMRIAGKGVDKFNKQQQTPLHLAVKLNFLEAVDILLKSNANVNAVDCTGSSSIHMAVQGRSTDCLTMLLERCPNADLNVRNFDGLTPLHIAVDNGDLQQVEKLLKYNADIDVTDGKSGRTALFRAAESNQKAMVELLLNKGANPDVPNYAGVTTAMAAQGRNLHGVLKLLGSVATDKFPEYETKPGVFAVESKVTPVYLGFQPSDNMAFSHNSSARNIKSNDQEIMCLIEPKVNKENSEISSNETKVFHNVFVVSQGRSRGNIIENKSVSEPPSPEIKMDITEDKDIEKHTQSGLMSLPEGIFCHTEDDRKDKPFVRQGSVITVRQSEPLPSLHTKFHNPVSFPRVTNSAMPVVKNEQKSVMVQIVPQSMASSSTSTTVISTLSTTANMASSNILSKLSPKTVSSAQSVPSSVMPLTQIPSSSDTVTLTGMQARLFQMLLKMYNIDQSNETPTSSSNRLPPLSSVVPKLALSQSSLLSHPSTSSSVISLYQNQETVGNSSIQQIPKYFDGHVTSNHERNTGNGISSQSFIKLPSTQYKLTGTGRSNFDHSLDSDTSKVINPERAEESPLNLSTTSNRQSHIDTDGRGNITLCLKKSDVDSTNKTVPPSPDVIKGVKNEQSPIQKSPVEKVISIEIHRIPDIDSGNKDNGEESGEIEMLLLPAIQQKEIPGTVSSGQLKSASIVTLPVARTVKLPSVPHDISSTKSSEHQLSGPIVTSLPDFQVSTSVSQKTTSIVRNYLSPQNPMSFHNQSSAPSSETPNHSSVPTVLDLVAEAHNPTQKSQVVTLTRNPISTITMGKTTLTTTGSQVSTAIVWPAKSSNPVFLHQGQVIDLSKNKVTECNTSTPKFTSSLLNPEAVHDKIIGFSGAILSVVPSKLERLDRQAPKESVCRDVQKKRGRKSLKSLQGAPLETEGGLSKINSETDEKLKKFLDAKKLENSLSVLPETADGMLNKQSNGIDLQESDVAQADSRLSENQVHKTVGIFSGNVQHVKAANKLNVLSSHMVSYTPLISQRLSVPSPDVSSLLGNAPSCSSTQGLNLKINADYIESTSSKLVASEGTIGRNVLLKSSSESNLETSDNIESNCPDNNLFGVPTNVATIISEGTEFHSSKKSRRSKKPLVITESNKKIVSMLNKKGPTSQSYPDKNSKNSVGRDNSKRKKKSLFPSKEVSNNEEKRNTKHLLSSTLLQTMKNQDQNSGNSDNMQTILSDSDQSQEMNKRQRRKKSTPQVIKRVQKSALSRTIKPQPDKSARSSAQVGVHAGSNEDILEALSTHHKDSSHTGSNEVSQMEIDDDDCDEQSALCIEEPEDSD